MVHRRALRRALGPAALFLSVTRLTDPLFGHSMEKFHVPPTYHAHDLLTME